MQLKYLLDNQLINNSEQDTLLQAAASSKPTADETDKVHDTAFWMAGCRAALVTLSQDSYAKFWLNEASLAKHHEYITEVSETENIALSLRCRYFLETVRAFLKENPGAIFINIGAGFSSYPFLLSAETQCVEVDCEDNVEKKKLKIQQLVANGTLPPRNIEFFAADLNDLDQIISLSVTLKNRCGNQKSFILLEGLLYYIPQKSIDQLFELARSIQTPNSQMGFSSWNPEAYNYPTYKRFCNYFRTQNNQDPPKFTVHKSEDLKTIANYELIEQTEYVKLSQKFGMQPALNTEDDVFWETLTLLRHL